MSAIYVLIGISLVVALGFLLAFLWAVKSGQYEDDYSPAVRMLFDDQPGRDTEDTPSTSSPNTASTSTPHKESH